MHIEPGLISQAKIALANVAASGLLLSYARGLITRPADIVRTLLATIFFTFFMQSFHVQVGPSELHFIGAMAMYLTLGFVPTLIGFAAGLLLQAIVFDPTDMMNLAANALTLITPLIALHYTFGRKLREGAKVNFQQILKMDAMYYAGVVAMVGFWLSMSAVATPFAAWATFASSYLVVVACEPVFTYVTVRLLKDHQDKTWVKTCFAVSELKLAK
jgi:ABC-type Co2+ transport system permease subunit